MPPEIDDYFDGDFGEEEPLVPCSACCGSGLTVEGWDCPECCGEGGFEP